MRSAKVRRMWTRLAVSLATLAMCGLLAGPASADPTGQPLTMIGQVYFTKAYYQGFDQNREPKKIWVHGYVYACGGTQPCYQQTTWGARWLDYVRVDLYNGSTYVKTKWCYVNQYWSSDPYLCSTNG